MAKQRIVKRYTNRKLYDTEQSRYVTLEDIARLVREGEDVRVVDNEAGEDLTAVTLAQIILEEEKRKTNLVSVAFLRKLIHSGEAAVQDIGDAASRSIEVLGELTEKATGRVRDVARDGGRAIDDLFGLPQRQLEELRVATQRSVNRLRQSPAVQREVDRIEKSLHAIEGMLANLKAEAEDEQRAREDQTAGAGATGATGATVEPQKQPAAASRPEAEEAIVEAQPKAEAASGNDTTKDSQADSDLERSA
jgi:polyhydroxyalkanoate synthesis repressor PhaR